MVSLITIATSVFLFPVHGFCDYSNQLHDESLRIFLSKFDEIKRSLPSFSNRNLAALDSVQSLLNEINSRYNTSISMDVLFQLSRTRISSLELEENTRALLNQVLSLLESTNSAISIESGFDSQFFEIFGYGIYPPWEWNWFGINKKKSTKELTAKRQITYPGPIPKDDGSIPDDLIICGIEALVAALLFLIPSGYTQAVAIAICGDLTFRAVDGVKEISAKNREKQNSNSP